MAKQATQQELHEYFIGLCDLTSQAEVAKDLDFSRTYVNEIYKGTRPINQAVAEKLGYEMKITFEKVRKSVDNPVEIV